MMVNSCGDGIEDLWALVWYYEECVQTWFCSRRFVDMASFE